MTKEIVEALRVVYDIADDYEETLEGHEALKTVLHWLEGQERFYGIKNPNEAA